MIFLQFIEEHLHKAPPSLMEKIHRRTQKQTHIMVDTVPLMLLQTVVMIGIWIITDT